MINISILLLVILLIFPLHWNTSYFREMFVELLFFGISILTVIEIWGGDR